MATIQFNILNQLETPAFYASTLATRPAFGYIGRIFIATDSPYGIYRDTGSAWVQIASNGSGGFVPYSGADDNVDLGSFNLISNAVAVNGVASAFRQFIIQTSGSGRWAINGQGAESGSNAGTNFSIARYDDAGASIDSPFSIVRSTGVATFIYQLQLSQGLKATNSIDISWGGQSILAGADNNAATRTDSTQKVMRFTMPHYTNANNSISLIVGIARTSVNDLYIGGGSGVNNAATDIRFYTAANTNTATGSQRARITINGNFLIGTDTDDGVNKLQVTGNGLFSGTFGIGGVNDSVKGGIYTPTLTTISTVLTNVNVGNHKYIRVGNIVTVTGYLGFDQPLGYNQSQYTLTLPITQTNVGLTGQGVVTGTIFSSTLQNMGEIFQTATNSIYLNIFTNSVGASSGNIFYSFSYEIA